MEDIKGNNVISMADDAKAVSMDDIMIQEQVATVGQADMGSMPVVNDTSDISRFLSREVLIDSFTWQVNTVLSERVDPWTAFLTNATVAEKIKYFSRLRGNLCVRLNISATPFHYGACLVTYRPHPGFVATNDPQYNLATTHEAAQQARNRLIIESQLVGQRFQPCYDHTVVLKCPYVHYRPGIEISSGNFSTIGSLTLTGMTSLRHANLGTDPVSIEVFACMEDVTLDVPTAVAQGFSLEAAAKKVTNYLEMGVKATKMAGEFVPTAMTALAMLGFSRPLTLDPPTSVRNIPFQNMSNYDLPDTSERLALSANSEAQLDGFNVGVQGDDPLMVAEIAGRTAYIIQAPWDSSMTRGSFLIGSIVSPQQSSVSTYTKGNGGGFNYGTTTHVCQTPVAFAASVFTHWKCDMVYTFSVIASPYHKGRLRIWYDPNLGNTNSPAYNLTNSTVINLAEESSAVVRVPWQNVRDACATHSCFIQNTYSNYAAFLARTLGATESVCNGMIMCEVLNPLSGPTDSSPVSVILDVHAENFVGFGPRLPRSSTEGSEVIVSDMEAAPFTPLSYDVACGDAVASFRQLFKRYSQEYALQVRSDSVDGPGRQVEVLLPIYLPPPAQVSSDRDGLDVTVPLTAGSLWHDINYTSFTFRSYITQAFALCRGSVRWKVFLSSKNGTSTGPTAAAITRFYGSREDFGGVNHRRYFRLANTTAGFQNECDTARNLRQGVLGDEAVQIVPISGDTVATMDVEFPFVSPYRAINPRASIDSSGDSRDVMNAVLMAGLGDTVDTSFFIARIFTAGGEDYNTFYFLHAPAFLSEYPPIV